MTDLLIIGGGAAGLSAAVTAKSLGDSVLVLERMDRVGKKILATGNGRCNLMNTGHPVYPGGYDFANRVLAHAGAEYQKRFWAALGLFLREEDAGRVYPFTSQASTVLDTLRFTLEKEIRTGISIREIRKIPHGWEASDGQQVFQGKRILVAGGGCAQEKLGSDGSCIKLLEHLGYASSRVRPALTQIETEMKPIRGLEGIRIKAKVRALVKGKCVHSERGEVLFTSYGLSGVCIMQSARYVDEQNACISLHLYDGTGFNRDEMRNALALRLRSLSNDAPAERLLTGFLPPRVSHAVFLSANIPCRQAGELMKNHIEVLLNTMEDFRIPVIRLKGFEHAQVTRGGIHTDQFSDETMESLKDSGLYAAGEVLDVDGDCGGFNLMFAFAGGILAGKNGRRAPWEEGL